MPLSPPVSETCALGSCALVYVTIRSVLDVPGRFACSMLAFWRLPCIFSSKEDAMEKMEKRSVPRIISVPRCAAFRFRRNPIIYRANTELHRVPQNCMCYTKGWRLAHSSSERDVCVTSFFLSLRVTEVLSQ